MKEVPFSQLVLPLVVQADLQTASLEILFGLHQLDFATAGILESGGINVEIDCHGEDLNESESNALNSDTSKTTMIRKARVP